MPLVSSCREAPRRISHSESTRYIPGLSFVLRLTKCRIRTPDSYVLDKSQVSICKARMTMIWQVTGLLILEARQPDTLRQCRCGVPRRTSPVTHQSPTYGVLCDYSDCLSRSLDQNGKCGEQTAIVLFWVGYSLGWARGPGCGILRSSLHLLDQRELVTRLCLCRNRTSRPELTIPGSSPYVENESAPRISNYVERVLDQVNHLRRSKSRTYNTPTESHTGLSAVWPMQL